MFTIRIAIPDLDYPRMAEIFSQEEPEIVTPATIREAGKQEDGWRMLRALSSALIHKEKTDGIMAIH